MDGSRSGGVEVEAVDFGGRGFVLIIVPGLVHAVDRPVLHIRHGEGEGAVRYVILVIGEGKRRPVRSHEVDVRRVGPLDGLATFRVGESAVGVAVLLADFEDEPAGGVLGRGAVVGRCTRGVEVGKLVKCRGCIEHLIVRRIGGNEVGSQRGSRLSGCPGPRLVRLAGRTNPCFPCAGLEQVQFSRRVIGGEVSIGIRGSNAGLVVADRIVGEAVD